MLNGSPTETARSINIELLNWVARDAHDEYEGNKTTLESYHPETPMPPSDQWLHEFLNVNLNETTVDLGPNPKTECLYYLGFEQSYHCSEANCVLHCDWGICFHEVKNERSEVFSDLQSFNTKRELVTGWLDQFMTRRFPNITFGYDCLVNNAPFTIH